MDSPAQLDNVVSIHAHMDRNISESYTEHQTGRIRTLKAVECMDTPIYNDIATEFLSSGLDLKDVDTFELVNRNIYIIDGFEAASYFPRLKLAETLKNIKYAWLYLDHQSANNTKHGLIRPYPSIKDKKGKPIKYLAFPRELSAVPIIPEPLRSDDTVYLTEGVKKCLSLINLGYDSIAVQGVYNVGQRYNAEEIYSNSAVQSKVRDKDLVVVFDSDFQNNSQVLAALKEVILYFQKLCKTVSIVVWEYTTRTKGIDDYLFANGVEATKKLLSNPISLENFTSYSQKLTVSITGLERDTNYIKPDLDLIASWRVTALTEEAQIAEIHSNIFTTVAYLGNFYQFNYILDQWETIDRDCLNRQLRLLWGQYKNGEEMMLYATKLLAAHDVIRENKTIKKDKRYICAQDVIIEIDYLNDYAVIEHDNNQANKIKFFIRDTDIVPLRYYRNISDTDRQLWDNFSQVLPQDTLDYVLKTNALAFDPERAFSRLGRSMKFLFHYGSGSNGKDLLRKVLLGSFVPSSICAISLQNIGKDFALESYLDKSISWSSENIPKDLAKLEILKNICTQDELEVTRKHKTSIRYKFALVANFNTNHLPNLSELYESMDRYAIINYPYVFVDELKSDNARKRRHYTDEEIKILQTIALKKMISMFCETMRSGCLEQPELTNMIQQGKNKSWLNLMIGDEVVKKGGLITIDRLKILLYQYLQNRGEGTATLSPSGWIFEPYERSLKIPKSTDSIARYCHELGFRNLVENKLQLESKRVNLYSIAGISAGTIDEYFNDMSLKYGKLTKTDEIKITKIWDKNQ